MPQLLWNAQQELISTFEKPRGSMMKKGANPAVMRSASLAEERRADHSAGNCTNKTIS
jgi:hypothetical protein